MIIDWILNWFKPKEPSEPQELREWKNPEEIKFEFNKQRLRIFKDIQLSFPVKSEAIKILDARETLELSRYYKRTGELQKATPLSEEITKATKEITTQRNVQFKKLNDDRLAAQWRDRKQDQGMER